MGKSAPQTAKRPDVKQRKLDAKGKSNTVVQLTLRQFCKPTAYHIPWDHVVRSLAQVALEARVLANLHILRLLEAEQSPFRPPTGQHLTQLSQNFFYQCLSAVGSSTTTVGDAAFRDSVGVYTSWKPPHFQSADTTRLSRGAFNNLSLSLYTEFRNHVATNFFTKFKKYVQARHDLSGPDASALVRKIYSHTSSSHALNEPLVSFYHAKLPSTPSKRRIWSNPVPFLPLFHTFQRFQAQHPEAGRQKAFSLLPHKAGFKASFFKICTRTLYNLLKVSKKMQRLRLRID